MSQIEKEAKAKSLAEQYSSNHYMFDYPTEVDNAVKEAFVAGYLKRDHIAQQQADKMAVEWISVKDRLPDNGQWVLVINEKNRYDLANYYDNTWSSSNDNAEDNVYALNDFTHWMLLPEPPKEKGYE